MNKKIYSLMLTLLAFTGLMSSCSSSDELVFDHERQQFETRADRILLEFIAPFGTTADEEIYITGAFNGDDEAIGDAQYLLTKAPNSNVKLLTTLVLAPSLISGASAGRATTGVVASSPNPHTMVSAYMLTTRPVGMFLPSICGAMSIT